MKKDAFYTVTIGGVFSRTFAQKRNARRFVKLYGGSNWTIYQGRPEACLILESSYNSKMANLISAAAEAVERFEEDELELYAADRRKKGGA